MGSEMASRDRVQRVLNGELPDRLPFNFWMDRDLMAKYDEKWGADFRVTRYGADVIEAFAIMPFWSGLPMKTLNDGKTVWQLEPLVDNMKDAVNCRFRTRQILPFTPISKPSVPLIRIKRSGRFSSLRWQFWNRFDWLKIFLLNFMTAPMKFTNCWAK